MKPIDRAVVVVPLLDWFSERQSCREPEARIEIIKLARWTRLVARTDARQQQHVVGAASCIERWLAIA